MQTDTSHNFYTRCSYKQESSNKPTLHNTLLLLRSFLNWPRDGISCGTIFTRTLVNSAHRDK